VRWVDGGADELGEQEADLILMAGHVAQFFVRDDDWRHALSRIRRALRPGGRLAFETRNPASRPWEAWTPQASRRVIELPEGHVETWYDVTAVQGRIVDHSFSYRFSTGELVREEGSLAFREHDEVAGSLVDAGLETERVYGDWDRSPVSDDSPELIYIARRRSDGESPTTQRRSVDGETRHLSLAGSTWS
jgi:SAM-dependent methyltransferase